MTPNEHTLVEKPILDTDRPQAYLSTEMPTPSATPKLIPGRVYRTRELRAFSANPSRWAKSMVKQGVLRQISRGLYYVPVLTKFGPGAPRPEEVLRAFLGSDDFLITGPYIWNALGLGTTQMFAVTLVYNRERTGEITVGGRRFWFRRVRFPNPPPIEWYIIDLLHNEKHMGEDTTRLDEFLAGALRAGRFDADKLTELAREYAHPAERERILAAVHQSRMAA